MGRVARVEPMLMIVPLRFRKSGSAALMPSHAPFRLTVRVRSQSASSVDSTVPRELIPALLTRTSSPPQRSSIVATALAQWAARTTSSRIPATSIPICSKAAAV